MDFFKKLLGIGGSMSSSGDRGIYFYVQPKHCKQMARVRIDPYNDVSEDDNGNYFVRKDVRVAGCPFPVELRVQFDRNRKAVETFIDDGSLVTKEQYEAWEAEKAKP
jgi:hypothetical protein